MDKVDRKVKQETNDIWSCQFSTEKNTVATSTTTRAAVSIRVTKRYGYSRLEAAASTPLWDEGGSNSRAIPPPRPAAMAACSLASSCRPPSGGAAEVGARGRQRAHRRTLRRRWQAFAESHIGQSVDADDGLTNRTRVVPVAMAHVCMCMCM